MTSKLKLKVNGSTQDVDVEANTMLLYVLRDAMELHGPKFGCGLVISPDGLHNQIEGNIIQSLSRTQHEESPSTTAASPAWSGPPTPSCTSPRSPTT